MGAQGSPAPCRLRGDGKDGIIQGMARRLSERVRPGSRFFGGIAGDDLERLLKCLAARCVRFSRHAFLLRAGEPADRVGFILRGAVRVIRETASGRRTILQEYHEGESFGGGFTLRADDTLPVSVQAITDGELLMMSKPAALSPCTRSCPAHARLLRNFVYVLSNRCYRFQLRSIMMAQRTIRGRLLTYLRQHARRLGRREFEVPFNRQALADFLCVDRAALSATISRLCAERRLAVSHSRFTLLK